MVDEAFDTQCMTHRKKSHVGGMYTLLLAVSYRVLLLLNCDIVSLTSFPTCTHMHLSHTNEGEE